MGQEQSLSGNNPAAIFNFGSRGYESIPAHKPKIMAIFSKTVSIFNQNEEVVLHSKVIEGLVEHFEVTTASYNISLDAKWPAFLSLDISKYISVKQALDNVDHLVFFSVLPTSTAPRNAFSSTGNFSLFFDRFRSSYYNYKRFGPFTMCYLCQDFNGGDPELSLIYNNGSVVVKDTGTSPNIESILASVYIDNPLKADGGMYWWSRSFFCRYTYNRLYLGSVWVDEDALETNVKKNLGDQWRWGP